MSIRAAAWPLAAAAILSAGAAAGAPLTGGVLGHLVGTWTITGTTLGRQTRTGAVVTPEFGGAFLEMHVRDPAGRDRYEARIFFGEAADHALVVHWLDATGGETSRTLGTGHADGDVVSLVFPYPDGTFRDRLAYDPAQDRWRLVIETGPVAKPSTFSDWSFRRAAPTPP